MKVLKEGKSKEAGKKIVCPKCDSELEYTEQDIINFINLDSSKEKQIVCPVCNNIIKVG